MKGTRNFLTKPIRYDPKKHNIDGWFACEYKFGLKCFWDGGISRGQPMRDIPWVSNINNPKDNRESTGLWSQNLAPLKADDSWLNNFPTVPLEGVIYQEDGYKYFGVMGSPNLDCIFQEGTIISGSNYTYFKQPAITEWQQARIKSTVIHLTGLPPKTSCDLELQFLNLNLATWGLPVHLLKYKKLSDTNGHADLQIQLKNNHTGLMLRDPKSHWTPGANPCCLVAIGARE